MARFKLHSDNPDVRARTEAFYQDQADRRFAAQVASNRAVFEWVKRNRWSIPLALAGGLSWLVTACTRPASSGVIPTEEASHTPGPSDTPTGMAEHTATNTATLAMIPPLATELLVAPPAFPTEGVLALPDADGDGFPDFPNPDLNGDGRIVEREMTAGVVAVAQWFNIAAQTFAEGKGAPLVVETIAHFFGHSATTLRAEGTIDLQWVPDSALDLNDPTVANGLGAHDGVGILTTGAHLSEVMSRFARQLAPDHEASAFTRVLSGLTDQLGLENLWRPGLPANLTDEIGLKGDMCVVTDKGSDAQPGVAERNPVVVQTEIEVGEEFQDPQNRWHVSPDSPMGVVARLVRNAELPKLQQLWHANGEAVEVTQVTSEHSIAIQVHLVGEHVDGQLVFCGRSQEGVQASPTQSVTPTATETLRPQGGGQPPATEVPQPQDTHIPQTNTPVPSATPTPRPTETPVPPTNTPVGPTEAPPPTATPDQPATEIPSRTPLPTVTEPVHTETSAPPETPKATLTPLPTPENSPTPSAPN